MVCNEETTVTMTTSYTSETDEVRIMKLDPSAWVDYKLLRLEALATDPHAFQAAYDEYRAKPDAFWQGQLLDAANNTGFRLLFAQQEHRLVGMLGARATAERDVVELLSVFVAKEARRKGVGKALVSAAIRDMRRDHTIKKIRLHVNAAQTPAVRLYTRFGFVVVDRDRVRCGDGNEHDVYLMERTFI